MCNYVSCHDNHTLWDRLTISNPADGVATRQRMHRLALATVLTSQGIAFLHAGTEMFRSKGGDENSYKSPDAVNAIKWEEKGRHRATVDYVRDLIALRKGHPAFRMRATDTIARHLTFGEKSDGQLITYRIQNAPGEDWADVLVALNAHAGRQEIQLPEGTWRQVVDGSRVQEAGLDNAEYTDRVYVEAISANVFFRAAEE